jgi:predicted MFS family arabinose efflux permease
VNNVQIKDVGLKREMASVFKNFSYLFLHIGFFSCGLHVAFIATHFPGVMGFYRYSGSVIALCFSILGICNVLGCILVGIVGKYLPQKNILSTLYTIRVLLIGFYLIAPKTIVTFVIFSIITGFTFGSTVPPTGDIAARLIHPKYLSALFGLIFVTHQIGSFFGAWLGGVIMDKTGSYFYMWILDVSFSIIAAIISLKIKRNYGSE